MTRSKYGILSLLSSNFDGTGLGARISVFCVVSLLVLVWIFPVRVNLSRVQTHYFETNSTYSKPCCRNESAFSCFSSTIPEVGLNFETVGACSSNNTWPWKMRCTALCIGSLLLRWWAAEVFRVGTETFYCSSLTLSWSNTRPSRRVHARKVALSNYIRYFCGVDSISI